MIKLKTWDLGSVLKNLFHLIKQTAGTGANHYTFQSSSFHCIKVWLCTFRDYPKWNRVELRAKRYIVPMIGATLVVLQTSIAQDQTKTAKAALFNDKINAAMTVSHVQRQITKWDENSKAQNR